MTDNETFDPGDQSTQNTILKNSYRKGTGDGIKLIPECTQAACRDDNDINKFECEKCNRFVHYRCTNLPLYQIQRYLTKNFRKYHCVSCVKIQPSLKNIFPAPPENTSHIKQDPNDIISMLRKEIDGKVQQLESLAKTNRMLNATIQDLTRNQDKKDEEIHKLNDKIKMSNENEKSMEFLLNEREEELAMTLNKLHQLEQESQDSNNDSLATINELKAKHNEENKTRDAEIKSIKDTVKSQSQTIATLRKDAKTKEKSKGQVSSHNESMVSLTKFIDEKFEKVESNLMRSLVNEVSQINSKLENKLKTVLIDNQPNTNTDPKVGLREIMRQQHDENIKEENDRKLRACNLIVHGIAEADKQSDTNFVIKLFEDLQIKNLKHKTFFRLGKKIENNTQVRPLKIVLNNEESRIKILSNLTKLKGIPAYTKISITEDFSVKERALLKEWASKAKEANEKEDENSNFIWRVRGSPKNRLFLKKFTKRNMDR